MFSLVNLGTIIVNFLAVCYIVDSRLSVQLVVDHHFPYHS